MCHVNSNGYRVLNTSLKLIAQKHSADIQSVLPNNEIFSAKFCQLFLFCGRRLVGLVVVYSRSMRDIELDLKRRKKDIRTLLNFTSSPSIFFVGMVWVDAVRSFVNLTSEFWGKNSEQKILCLSKHTHWLWIWKTRIQNCQLIIFEKNY